MQQAQQSQQVQQAQQAQQSPQSGLNQAVLDRLSQIEQQLQTGLVSASSSGDNVEMPELLQAVQVCNSCRKPSILSFGVSVKPFFE